MMLMKPCASITTQVMDLATSQRIWEHTIDFVCRFHKGAEPKMTDLHNYLGLMDADLREVLQFANADKYSMKIKPRTWQFDMTRFFTVAYLCMEAHSSCDFAVHA